MTRPVYYKDTRVGPGSDLYAALQDARNPKLKPDDRKAAKDRAESIYQECEKEFRKWFKQ
ncbi:hypothetical protein [Burkholderia cenocepacia]|uniref:hypothetical protein n=1 Tax=Burkholderia cenocepacia TaxID=95486 RepID=UPI0038CBF7BA